MIPRLGGGVSRSAILLLWTTTLLVLCQHVWLLPNVAHAWVVATVATTRRSTSSSSRSSSMRRSRRSCVIPLPKHSSFYFQLAASISTPPPPGSTSSSNSLTGGDGNSQQQSTSATSSSPSLTDCCSPEDTAIVKQLFVESSHPIYLFDGLCNFCNGSVHLCYDLDHDCVLRFTSLQSKTGRAVLRHFGKGADDLSSLVLLESPDTCYFESDAVLKLMQLLTGLPVAVRGAAGLAHAVVPAPLRDAVYHILSDHRHVFGSSADTDCPTCRVDLDPNRFVDDCFALGTHHTSETTDVGDSTSL
jgi:predicted DCC family thiol-disulfide oxidoreductase YuxK